METILYIFIGLVVGAVISWLAVKSKMQGAHQKELTQKAEEFNKVNGEKISLTAQVEAQKDSLEVAKKAMLDSFKSVATEALTQNNKQFLTLAETQLGTQVKVAEGDLDQRKTAIEEMLKPVKESIDAYKKRIEELEKGSAKTFGQVSEMLSNIQTTHVSLQRETGALVNALRNPRVRGRWGEIGLKRTVEFSGMSAHCDFNEQVYTEAELEDDSVLKPDMVI